MKLKTLTQYAFFEVTGTQLAQVQIPAGTYDVKLQKNPSGRTNDDWYVLTKPEQAGEKFKGKTIGVAKIFIMNQSGASIVS
jgi:hypothetical protein